MFGARIKSSLGQKVWKGKLKMQDAKCMTTELERTVETMRQMKQARCNNNNKENATIMTQQT
jgi:hypothetical protein